jgi:hypothetical protein
MDNTGLTKNDWLEENLYSEGRKKQEICESYKYRTWRIGGSFFAVVCVFLPRLFLEAFPESHRQKFDAGSTTQITEFGYVNETAFWNICSILKNIVFLINTSLFNDMGGHALHCALDIVNYCHYIETL